MSSSPKSPASSACGLSVHAVDVAAGRPAAGMRVEVFRLAPERRLLAEGRLGVAGALDHPVARTRLEPGLHEVLFHIGEFLGTAGTGFLEVAPVRFRIVDPDQHYHLPLKFTAWGYSVFRGS